MSRGWLSLILTKYGRAKMLMAISTDGMQGRRRHLSQSYSVIATEDKGLWWFCFYQRHQPLKWDPARAQPASKNQLVAQSIGWHSLWHPLYPSASKTAPGKVTDPCLMGWIWRSSNINQLPGLGTVGESSHKWILGSGSSRLSRAGSHPLSSNSSSLHRFNLSPSVHNTVSPEFAEYHSSAACRPW